MSKFKRYNFKWAVAHPITARLKEIKKRRALRGKQRVELLIHPVGHSSNGVNSAGKRTVVVLNPSFFYFFNPFFVMRNQLAAVLIPTVEEETKLTRMKKLYLLTTLLIFTNTNFLAAQSSWQWAHSFGSASFDEGLSVDVNNSNDCFITGRFASSFQIGSFNLAGHPSYMDIFVSKLDNNGSVMWAKEAGSPDMDWPNDIAADNNGNCIVTGYFNSTANFNGTLITSNGNTDVFIAKYDGSGNLSWIRNFGSSSSDAGKSICIDNVNNIYVTGAFHDSMTVSSTTIYSAGPSDIFLVKYDANGTFQWIKQISGVPGAPLVSSISSDNANNLYVSGQFADSLYSGMDTIYNFLWTDLFLAKFDSNGNPMWLRDAAGQMSNKDVVCYSSTTDNLGNTYLTGTFPDTIIFGSYNAIAYTNQNDAFLCKFDAAGNKLWIRHGGGGGFDNGMSVVDDNNGNIFLIGDFFGTSTFGNVTVTNNFNLYASSLLVKYDSTGNALWGTKTIQTTNNSRINKIQVQDSSLYAIGFHSYAASLGSFSFNGFGDYDVIVGKLNGVTSNVFELVDNLSSVLVYPNPANEKITINLNQNQNVSVTNLLGEKIIENNYPFKTSGKFELNISSLTSGVYFIKIDNMVRKFVKQRN